MVLRIADGLKIIKWLIFSFTLKKKVLLGNDRVNLEAFGISAGFFMLAVRLK